MYNSSNPFPSSIHGFPPLSSSFYDHEKDGVYSHHHNHHPFVAGDHSTTVAPPLVISPSTKGSEVVQYGGGNNNNNNSGSNHFSGLTVSFPSKNRVSSGSKKDRHSKIFTAQGPRDRRVRLSIDISRKFFGLQDLLGFDKASKTLDWLFTKSKTAIKDLVEEMKQQHTSSSTLTNQCEEVFMGKNGGDQSLDKTNGKKSKKTVPKCGNGAGKRKTKKPTQQKHGFHVNLAARSQSRAEARARARERTIEKLQKLRNNYESKINVVGDHHHHHHQINYCYLQSNCGNNQIQSSSNDQEVKIGESSSAAIEQKLQFQPQLLC